MFGPSNSVAGRLAVEIVGDVAGLTKDLDKAAKDVGDFAGDVEKKSSGLTTSLSDMGGRIVDIGKKAALALGGIALAAGAAAGYTVREFGDFDQGVRQIFTLMPDASAEMRDQLVADVKQISSEMGILTDQALPALYDAIGSGVPPENVFSFLEVAQMAAVGGVTDLTTTVDGLTSVVNAYGADVLDVATASDVMFQTVNVGKVSFAELANSLYNVSPTAAALGVSFEEIGAAIAAMTAQGVPASVATTYLRQMLVSLSEEGSETSDTFKTLSGKSFRDFVAAGGTVQEALKLMEKHAKDTGVGINDLFGSVWAGSAALTLTGKGTEAFTDALATMEDAAGATASAYEIMDEGLNRRIEKATTRINTKLIELGEKFMPIVESYVLPAIDAAVDGLGRFVDWVEKSGIITDGLVPALGAVANAFDWVSTRIQTFDADSSPLFQHMITAFEPVVAFYQEQLAKLGEWWEENGETVMQALNNVWAAISWVLDRVLTLFEWVWPYLEQIISGNLDAALGVVKLFTSILAGDWESAGDALVNISLGIMKALEGIFSLGFDAIATGIEWVMNGIAEFMTNIWKGIVQAVEDSINAMIDRINGFIQGINSVTEKVGISLPTVAQVELQAAAIEAPTFTAKRWSDMKATAGIPDWDEIGSALKDSRSARDAGEAPNGGGVVIENLVVNSPKADAATMMNTTKRTLRNIGTQVGL